MKETEEGEGTTAVIWSKDVYQTGQNSVFFEAVETVNDAHCTADCQ